MKLERIQKLAKQGESETLEFKKSTALMRSIFATVCVIFGTWLGSGYRLVWIKRKVFYIKTDMASVGHWQGCLIKTIYQVGLSCISCSFMIVLSLG